MENRRMRPCKWLFGLAACLVALLVAGQAGGEELTEKDIALKIQQTYEQTESLKADFLQTSTLSGMRHRQRKGSGTMVIQKPGLLRWDYETPAEQVLVSDGQTFSLYFAAEKQMIVTPAEEYLQEDITYGFFSGTGDILRDFTVKPVPDKLENENFHALELVPRQTHPQVESLYVWVDKSSFLIKRLQILDHLGSITDLIFFNLVVNKPYPVDYFNFTPPEGTEIIKQ